MHHYVIMLIELQVQADENILPSGARLTIHIKLLLKYGPDFTFL